MKPDREIRSVSRILLIIPQFLLPIVLLSVGALAQQPATYVETFDHGPGGWISNRRDPLPIFDGAAYLFGPWYLDSHHAPPGAGYLNMLMYLYTKGAKHNESLGGPNAFVRGNYPTD